MPFSDLNLSKPLLRALDEMGLETPTPIQERAFSVIMSGKDVVGIAQTGTGKTLAFLLPILRMWKFQKHRFPQILILVPTRELVVQIVEEIEKLTSSMNVVPVGVYGGVNMKVNVAEVEQGLDVLVGTPGRVYDLALHGALKFKAIRQLVIDEVDEMLELGFRTQLNRIIELLPERRQNLMFSATMTPEVEQVIEDTFNYPVTLEAAPTGTPLDNIQQHGYRAANFNTKMNLLQHLLQDKETYHRVLVFAPSKKMADVIFDRLDASFPEEVGVIHSNKSQNYRFRSLASFQDGSHRILLATDLVSRGLDLSDVSHVINFDTPDNPENYMHRIGRTGRADKTGTSLTFVGEAEEERLQAIENLMNRSVEMVAFPEEVPVSDELIPEETEEEFVANVKIKLDTTEAGAFHEKKKKNTKVKLSRKELQEKRNKPRKGQKKKRRKKRK